MEASSIRRMSKLFLMGMDKDFSMRIYIPLVPVGIAVANFKCDNHTNHCISTYFILRHTNRYLPIIIGTISDLGYNTRSICQIR